METEHHVRLTAPEMSGLWTQYMFDSMSQRFFEYALEHIEDDDIRSLYKKALTLSEKHLARVSEFFKQENHPIPQAFTDNDVNQKAAPLFQEPFYLHYLYIMSLQGLTGYGLSVGTSLRSDLRSYFIRCNTETMELFDQTTQAMLTKGLVSRPPVVNPAEQVSFVTDQGFLTGWFGHRRPLTSMEIGDITFNMYKMNLHIALKVAFAQTCTDKHVRKIIERGMQISTKHTEVFKSIFNEEKLNSPISLQPLVTDSTEAPFSDKYMMYQIQYSTQIAIAFYGTAMSVNARRDLGAHYTRLTAELVAYAEDCANLMIKNGWMEQPPMATDREKIAKKK
ncbi:DUF3231 family protein [Virgibacillus sp. MSP4-1]|uniref:DUF3231 family protein n=1 Tax=Virgibacillus sp. MSP4-1 TaxID=2700081 RepID=UPI00039C90EA|nr:DUF3231 family protein [Virgibacillus sp. MSP4-1]QHS21951.1 DUF3231 family protein [Virgibacillus sp. MSP4-1]